MSQNKRAYLYVATANVADARALLSKHSISYTEKEAIQDGIYELRFNAPIDKLQSISEEILDSGVKVQYSETKLPITGSIGSISASISASDMKTGSTDQTAGNAKYLKTDTNGQLYIAAPGAIVAGDKTATGTGSALATTASCKKIDIIVDASADNGILVGNSAGQTYPLEPGQAMTIEIDDISKIYVIRNGGSNATVHYFGS